MNEVERTVLTCLQAGNYDDALAAIKNVTDRDDAALFTSMVVELSEASAYARALCEGRLAAAPPDHDNPFCITLKKLQKMLWPAEMWDKAANSIKKQSCAPREAPL